jgi:hypothetical protein
MLSRMSADPTTQALANELRKLSSLHQALRWGLAHTPAWGVVDVVVQDEYTHDVIFAPDGGGATALVLDCT